MERIRILNFYKFVPLENIEEMRPTLKKYLSLYNTKGTVLLSPEGVNACLAIPPLYQKKLYKVLEEFFGPLKVKEQECKKFPFKRLLIRLKKETITFKENRMELLKNKTPYISPETLEEWYDNNKDMLVIDIRNDFEIAFGSFKNSINLKMSKFTEFKKLIETIPNELKNKPVVTYCTGGIRCEKAAPYMKKIGFKSVYQLEGGILNYFKRCGKKHYNGDCFVFDHRVSLDPNLQETDISFCTHCQKPIHDPEIKQKFSMNERFCEDCYAHIPKYLKKRWDTFLKKTKKYSESCF